MSKKHQNPKHKTPPPSAKSQMAAALPQSKPPITAAQPSALSPRPTPEQEALADISPAEHDEVVHLASQLPLPANRDEGLERLRQAEAAFKHREGKLLAREDKAKELEVQFNKRQQALEEGEQRLEKQRGELEDRRRRVDEEKRALEDKGRKLREQEDQIQALLKQSRERETQDLARQHALREQEANADAGFVFERRRSMERLTQELAGLRKEIEDAQALRITEVAAAHERARAVLAKEAQQCEEALRQLDEELRARRQRADTEIAQRREEQEVTLRQERERQEICLRRDRGEQEASLRQEREQVAASKIELGREQEMLRREQQRLRVLQQELGEDREDLDALVQERAAAELERGESVRRAIELRLQSARQRGEELDAALRVREDADRRFGQRTPEEILQELEGLRADKERLARQLAERPDRDAAERLRALEDERDQREAERQQLRQQVQELQTKLDRYRIGAAEMERLRDQKVALETHNQLLRSHLDALQEEVKRRLGDESNKACFPALLKADQDPAQQERPALDEAPVRLPALVDELKRRIASDRRKPLFYQEADLRCFLAGLSASRLLLLQGISGTGKTSLPRAVADALGWGHDKIEVQAGWRDRDDLIGHYNAFERRFHERPFLQAIYHAQGPAFQERPFLLVLDEMNLSHPEQYFADLLSALEEPDEHRRLLRLLPSAEGPGPRLLQGGRDLLVPANLWFIGTANHDETTKDFADKTYDRAHIMELPRHPPLSRQEDLPPRQQPLSLHALDRAFDRARREHEDKAQQVQAYIERHLAKLLEERFRIGFGNRLERQIRDFVPVLVAAGGSVSEAADHLLATKLLRRLRDRYDLVEQDLKDLDQKVRESWKELGSSTPPKVTALLRRELARLATREER